MKKVLLILVLFTAGCCNTTKLKDDRRELLVSLDNRYKQINILATNREAEYKKKKLKNPVWLKLLKATLPSWEAEIARYKKGQDK